MRPLEILLLSTALLPALRLLGALPRSAWDWTWFALLAFALALQLLLEGPRPPLLPLHACAALILLAGTLPPLQGSHTLLRSLGLISLLGLAIAGVIAAWLLPIYHLPPPTGIYAIGVTRLGLADAALSSQANVDPEGAAPDVQLWYPVAQPLAEARDWRAWLAQPAKPSGEALGLRDAEIAANAGALPLLVYFPGWPGTQIENYTLIRELVSQGYVLASLIYPASVDEIGEAAHHRIVEALERPADYSSEAAYIATVAQTKRRVRKRATDASRVIDRLLGLPEDSGSSARVASRIDAERIGIFGFSLGGAAAAQACTQDPRFKATVNLDGRLWAEARDEGLHQSRMLLGEPVVAPSAADLQSRVPDIRYNAREDLDDYEKLLAHFARDGGLLVTIHGTAHMNFTDRGLASPWKRLTEGGTIDARRAIAITNRYVLAFFDHWLRERDSPLLTAAPAELPEVSVQAFPRPH